MKKELKWNFTMMIMLLQFGHISSYIKLYNLENMLLACITVYDYIKYCIEWSDQNKDAYIKYIKQNHLVSTWPQDLQNECWVPFTDTLTIIAPP